MPTIRSISDLRNRADEISRICHATAEPVFITKNGREDLVVMSQAAYEQDQARLELYSKLDEAEAESEAGRGAVAHEELMARLKSKLG
ncbi:MAG: type II toxin-antitoxin system prevent-host-death family antitoxin [Elusimicrobiota bacterium]|nr:type II toxin-antitoxin system prevent-host-death family antitoxin [Elusimicrobiota bacterium]